MNFALDLALSSKLEIDRRYYGTQFIIVLDWFEEQKERIPVD